MDAMKHAIMKRRMKLAGDVDLEDMKDANMNPAEGSLDDLTIAENEADKASDGLAPDISENMSEGPEVEIEMEGMSPEQGMDQKSTIESFFSPDDVGKPGIKGKAANKMLEMLKRIKS